MADLLASLLPVDYVAPGVQDLLGGGLEGGVTCKGDGSGPSCTSPSSCGLWGGKPGSK